MYCNGLNPNIEMLYNPVSYPVSSGTPPLHTLLSWNHEEIWPAIDVTILVRITIFNKKNIYFKNINLYEKKPDSTSKL